MGVKSNFESFSGNDKFAGLGDDVNFVGLGGNDKFAGLGVKENFEDLGGKYDFPSCDDESFVIVAMMTNLFGGHATPISVFVNFGGVHQAPMLSNTIEVQRLARFRKYKYFHSITACLTKYGYY